MLFVGARRPLNPSRGLRRWSDDAACVAFAFAHVVTVMYHAVQFGMNGGAVDPNNLLKDRPEWIETAVHLYNRWEGRF